MGRAPAHTKVSLKRTKNQFAGVNGDGPAAPATKPRSLLLSRSETEAHFPPLAFEALSQVTKLWRRAVNERCRSQDQFSTKSKTIKTSDLRRLRNGSPFKIGFSP